jgi:hypothetical protein
MYEIVLSGIPEFGKLRVRPISDISSLWIIEEVVTAQGAYIEWPERFEKRSTAISHIANMLKSKGV